LLGNREIPGVVRSESSLTVIDLSGIPVTSLYSLIKRASSFSQSETIIVLNGIVLIELKNTIFLDNFLKHEILLGLYIIILTDLYNQIKERIFS